VTLVAAVIALALFVLLARGTRTTSWRKAAAAALAIVLVGYLGVAGGDRLRQSMSRPADWQIAACDIGQGDAVLVRSADTVALVDTGPDPALLHRCLNELGIDRINIASPPDSELAAILREMSNTLHRAHEEIRTLSFLLRPPWDDTPGAFERAVRELVDGFARRAGLLARIIVSGPPSPLCKRRELALFRILQEALVNIHRHAHADVVKVVLEYRADDVSLTIRDNGRGIASPEGVPPPRGVGILGMRARVENFGGALRILSGRTGTVVTAQLPV